MGPPLQSVRKPPLPIETVRDLLGIVRALYAVWHEERPVSSEHIARLARVGRDLRDALELAQKAGPGTIGNAAAWTKAERATEELGRLVDGFVPLRPAIQVTARRLLSKSRR